MHIKNQDFIRNNHLHNLDNEKYEVDLFLQLENGVGLCALLLSEANDALEDFDFVLQRKRKISLVTGVAKS